MNNKIIKSKKKYYSAFHTCTMNKNIQLFCFGALDLIQNKYFHISGIKGYVIKDFFCVWVHCP